LYLQNPKTSAIVKQLLAEGNAGELHKYFGSRMEFGTAGLRAAMGTGISHMNDLTIIQTTQVLCSAFTSLSWLYIGMRSLIYDKQTGILWKYRFSTILPVFRSHLNYNY